MTYLIGIRCEICGKTETRPYASDPTDMIPNGWATFEMNINPVDDAAEMTVVHHMCPKCAKAIREGREDPVHAYLSEAISVQSIITSSMMPKVEVVPLSDKFPEASEEEANL